MHIKWSSMLSFLCNSQQSSNYYYNWFKILPRLSDFRYLDNKQLSLYVTVCSVVTEIRCISLIFFFECGGKQGLYVAQFGLKLSIPLPQPPEYWDYRCMPPRLLLSLIVFLNRNLLGYFVLLTKHIWGISFNWVQNRNSFYCEVQISLRIPCQNMRQQVTVPQFLSFK
jgi:hypothetical protein